MLYDINGVHVVNKFLWANLKDKLGMTEAQYSGLVPVIPSQQIPALVDLASGSPFIVYTYLVASYDVDIWANVEQVTYRVFSDDEASLRRITNLIIDLFRRMDWSAQDVNDWLAASPDIRLDADDRKFDFKYIQVVGATGAEPFSQENGRQDSSVTVRIAYTHDSAAHVGGPGQGMRT